jgi:hypothetical protein
MKWRFWKRDTRQHVETFPIPSALRLGFAEGDVVYHKVTGKKAVIIVFDWADGMRYDYRVPGALVLISHFDDGEQTWTLAEMTKDAPRPVAAAPSAGKDAQA